MTEITEQKKLERKKMKSERKDNTTTERSSDVVGRPKLLARCGFRKYLNYKGFNFTVLYGQNLADKIRIINIFFMAY